MLGENVVITDLPSRTYTVPAALVASLGERVDLSTVCTVLQNSSPDSHAHLWASRIAGGLERDRVKQEQDVLASIGYDPEKYLYWGKTDPDDEDAIVAVGRIAYPYTNVGSTEFLDEKRTWTPATDDLKHDKSIVGVGLDKSLLAFTASSFMSGTRQVLLAYGEPLMFLDHQPLLASAATSLNSKYSEGRVYAVVDSTDTTAVMDVVQIKPGPHVYRRDGGAWVLDESMLDSLMSVSPPSIVELDETTASSVLEQVDAGKANQVDPDSEGSATEGEQLVPENDGDGSSSTDQGIATNHKKAIDTRPPSASSTPVSTGKPSDTPSKDTYTSNKNKSQLKDGSSAMVSALLQHYDELETLTAAMRLCGHPVSKDRFETKKTAMQRAALCREELELRQAQLQQVVLPALIADAASVHDATPDQLKAKHLRKYWVRGKGAVKIAWGAPGDFTRCVRQLQKYLGARAPGYCAKRHRETVGYWPGDKRNTGDLKGATGQKSFK